MNSEMLHWGVLIVLFVWLIIAGRLFCGKVCPVGYAQDLIFKIPFFIKVKTFKIDKYIRLLKYLNVFINFLLLPVLALLGYIASENEEAGPPKIILIALAASMVFAVIIRRPFCKYICSVGTLSSLFNKFSFYKYKTLNEKCIQCEVCVKKCKMDIIPYTMKNSFECIRCGYCKKVCPKGAIITGFNTQKIEQ
ncbi:MAG: 4Fe-4S binding protein [Spirochaetaceae bacterium]|jgi:polyferredoxin|nr:4Fe-4S binding protein [Spirochaetaceae bacterium]